MYSQQYSNKHNLKDKHFATATLSFNTISSSFFDDYDEDEELFDRLESIEQEMLAGAGITFKDVDDLDKRYGI